LSRRYAATLRSTEERKPFDRSRAAAVDIVPVTRKRLTHFPHNPITVFCSPWSWSVPIAAAAAVFAAVLLTTPPGFRALSDILLSSPRGPSADAAAYALGAAGSLALLTLLVLSVVLGALDLALRRKRSAAPPNS